MEINIMIHYEDMKMGPGDPRKEKKRTSTWDNTSLLISMLQITIQITVDINENLVLCVYISSIFSHSEFQCPSRLLDSLCPLVLQGATQIFNPQFSYVIGETEKELSEWEEPNRHCLSDRMLPTALGGHPKYCTYVYSWDLVAKDWLRKATSVRNVSWKN